MCIRDSLCYDLEDIEDIMKTEGGAR